MVAGWKCTLNSAKLIATLIVAALVASFAQPARLALAGSNGNLSKHDRELVAEAAAQGKNAITVLIAAKPGNNKSVESSITALGGTVRYRDDDISYMRAIIPIDKVDAAVAISGVQALDVDEDIPLEDPRPEQQADVPDGSQALSPQPPPDATTPQNNPYMPIRDTGATQFMAANPAWDGRDVTVGFLDTGIDLGHPALRTTTTGERKIVDWVTYTDPLSDNDPTWLKMQDQVSGSTFIYKGVTYTAPANTSYRIALINERDARLGGELRNDLNRDGNPTGSSGIFAVLWDTASNNVYVDTNQNNNFADELAMTDYRVRYDIGTFGTDNPATAVREVLPFVVQTDGKNKAVNIGIVSGAHGSHTAGIAAANGMFGGAMTGAAPGAKLVSVRVCLFVSSCTTHAMIEGMVWLAKQANVDVINMSISNLLLVNDGNNARVVLYDRLIEQYNVQIFLSAGNSGAGLNTIGDPAVASKAVSVGSYINKATWQSNYGSDSIYTDNLPPFSSRGPREDGGFKPNVVAPGTAISTVPTWQTAAISGGCLASSCPIGYALFTGSSMAAPQAAGAAALLISAAKQANVQKQPAQIRQALLSSARFISNYQSYEQGNGLVDVGAAWNLLKTNIKTVNITASVPVNTLLSGFLATPGFGQGIYDREGVTAGQSYIRRYTFTRTSGNGNTVKYNLSWGPTNDGTFSTASSLSLPLNKPVTLDVTVNPSTIGIHSAILNLDDPATSGIDYQTLNTVVAADALSADNGYTVTKTGMIGRNQSKSFFFDVPTGAPAFKVDMVAGGAPGQGQVRFLRFHPYGFGLEPNSSLNCYNPSAGGSTCEGVLSRTLINPQAGVWEITVEARRTSDVPEAAFSLTASILGASISPNPDIIASATLGTPVARSYTATNLFGAFTGRMIGTALGSAYRATPTIANHAQQQYSISVTPGSTSLRATIGGTSDSAADLDLYIYNCTTGTCVRAAASADGDSEESVTIANPAAGSWMVQISGFAVPAGTTTYNYVDVFTNSAFGSISVSDANAVRAAGSSWTVSGTMAANQIPSGGRVLFGNIEVRTNGNMLLGQSDVLVLSVNP